MLQPALEALRLYWPAVLLFQLLAVATAMAYFAFPAVREVFQAALQWKVAGGLCFVAGTNIVSGGVVPELLKWWLRPPGRKSPTWGDLAHLFVMLGVLAICVDFFYALQGWLFGHGHEWWRVGVKILFDQFGYTLFFAVPFILLWFAWKDADYSLPRTLRKVTPRFFKERLPPLFAPNVLFWIPALIALYSLPTELQFLLFIFLNGAWCTLMVFIARNPTRTVDSGA